METYQPGLGKQYDSTSYKMLIKRMPVENIIVYSGYIYFMNSYDAIPYQASERHKYDQGAIYRMDIEGARLERLTKKLASVYYIYENYIYYQVGTITEGKEAAEYCTQIIKMSLDGSEEEVIFTSENVYLDDFVMGNNIMYFNQNGNNVTGEYPIEICLADGSKNEFKEAIKKAGIDNIKDMKYMDGYLYFCGLIYQFNQNWEIEGTTVNIFRIHTENKKVELLIKNVDMYAMDEENIYYLSDSFVMRYLISTNEVSQIGEYDVTLLTAIEAEDGEYPGKGIEVAGDYIYIYDLGNFTRISTSGIKAEMLSEYKK